MHWEFIVVQCKATSAMQAETNLMVEELKTKVPQASPGFFNIMTAGEFIQDFHNTVFCVLVVQSSTYTHSQVLGKSKRTVYLILSVGSKNAGKGSKRKNHSNLVHSINGELTTAMTLGIVYIT